MPLPDLQAIYRRESADPTVMVADGQNVTITIRDGQLKVSDGVSSQRRERLKEIRRKLSFDRKKDLSLAETLEELMNAYQRTGEHRHAQIAQI